MEKWTKYIIRLFVVIIGLGLLLLSLFLLFIEYEKLIFIVLESAGKLYKIEEFKSEYLSQTKFQLIKFLIIVSTLFFFGVTYKWYKQFENGIIALLRFVFIGLRIEISEISKKDWYLFAVVFSLATIVKAYYFYSQPITNDEAFTFINYVNPGFAASLSYYNLTNNHILHSLLCNVFNLLPVSPVYTLRIASFIVGAVTLIVVFILFRKLLSNKAAFFAFLFFSFVPPIIQYGFLARGYSLILLFTTISTFVLFELVHDNKNRKKHWLIFIISSVLGFYSIPIYLYVFVSHFVFYFIYLVRVSDDIIRNLKELVVISAIIGLLVIVLYSPIVLVSGLDALIGNEVIESLSISQFTEQFPEFFMDYILWIFGGSIYLTGLSLVVTSVGLIYSFKKKQNLFILIVSFILVPILVASIQRIELYNRLFVFVILFISMAIGLFVELLLYTFKRKKIWSDLALYGSAILLATIMLLSLNSTCEYEKQKNNMAYRFVDKIENNSIIFSTNSVRYYTFLKFKAMFLDKKQIELIREDFDENYAYDYISETKAENENYVLLSKYKYSMVYNDKFIRLYKRIAEN